MKNRALITHRFEDVRTLYDVLPKGLQISGNVHFVVKIDKCTLTPFFTTIGNGPCLGHRLNGTGEYVRLTSPKSTELIFFTSTLCYVIIFKVWITYYEVIERSRYIGSGLLNKGITADNQTNIAIYAKNSPEV